MLSMRAIDEVRVLFKFNRLPDKQRQEIAPTVECPEVEEDLPRLSFGLDSAPP